MSSDVSVKVSREVYDILKSVAEKTGRSIKDVLEEAVKVYSRGAPQEHVEKEIVEFKHALIVSKFKTKCSLCKSTVDEGELVMWIKYKFSDNTSASRIICYSCLMKEKTLAKVYVKKRELQRTIRGLKALAEEYAERVEKLRAELRGLEIEKEIRELVVTLRSLALATNSPEYKQLTELALRLEELEKRLKGMRVALSVVPLKRKKE